MIGGKAGGSFARACAFVRAGARACLHERAHTHTHVVSACMSRGCFVLDPRPPPSPPPRAHTHAHIHTHTHTHAHTRTHAHAHTTHEYTHTNTNTNTRTHAHTHIRTHARTRSHLSECARACGSACDGRCHPWAAACHAVCAASAHAPPNRDGDGARRRRVGAAAISLSERFEAPHPRLPVGLNTHACKHDALIARAVCCRPIHVVLYGHPCCTRAWHLPRATFDGWRWTRAVAQCAPMPCPCPVPEPC